MSEAVYVYIYVRKESSEKAYRENEIMTNYNTNLFDLACII